MMWFLAVLIVLAIGAVVVVAGGEGAPLSREYDDRPDALVPPDRPLTGADLREVRLSTAVRGYRASEVDALLDRLARQLDASSGPDASPNDGTSSGTMEE
jgi:DivIVA domain-containing protein